MRATAVLVMVLTLSAPLAGCRRRAARTSAPPPTAGYAVAVTPTETPAASPTLADRMAVRAQELAYDLVPASYLEHGSLGEGQEESFHAVLEAGRCYRILGVAGASISDLDLVVHDENGNVVAEDDAEDATPVIGAGSAMLCPRWTGPFYVTARAFRGAGEYGLQVFRTP